MQRIFLLLSVLFLFLSGAVYGFVRFSHVEPLAKAAPSEAPSVQSVFTEEEIFPSETQAPQSSSYLIRAHNGHIGLFRCVGTAEPQLLEELHTSVSTLREEDQRLLNVGIRIATPEEAERIIENFEN